MTGTHNFTIIGFYPPWYVLCPFSLCDVIWFFSVFQTWHVICGLLEFKQKLFGLQSEDTCPVKPHLIKSCFRRLKVNLLSIPISAYKYYVTKKDLINTLVFFITWVVTEKLNVSSFVTNSHVTLEVEFFQIYSVCAYMCIYTPSICVWLYTHITGFFIPTAVSFSNYENILIFGTIKKKIKEKSISVTSWLRT